jgi:cadmium resistance protein CadD (predicted permease)
MWDKRIMRLLSIVYIVEGVVAILSPESMIRPTRWFAKFLDNPRYMRLGGIIPLALGIWLTLRQHQEERPPQPWYRRCFRG